MVKNLTGGPPTSLLIKERRVVVGMSELGFIISIINIEEFGVRIGLQIKLSFFNLNIKLCFYNCWQHTEFFICIFIPCGWLSYLLFVQEIRLYIETFANLSWTCAYITLDSLNFVQYNCHCCWGGWWAGS